MQFLISVIDDSTESATGTEMAAIDAFNDRLRAEGHWVFAGGLAAPGATPPSSTTAVAGPWSPTARSWSPRSTSAASGSSRPPIAPRRSRSPPPVRRPATGGSRSGRSWAEVSGPDPVHRGSRARRALSVVGA